jgi:hypothetical protein
MCKRIGRKVPNATLPGVSELEESCPMMQMPLVMVRRE